MQAPWTWLREKFASGTVTQLINTWRDEADTPASLGSPAVLGLRAYRTISILYACVVQLATSAAEPDYQVWTGQGTGKKQMPETDPLLLFLQAPHDEMSSFAFLEMLVTHLYTSGIAYVQKIRAQSSNQVLDMRLLRPDRTSLDETLKAGEPLRYVYRVGGIVKGVIPYEDMIVFKLPHPGDDYCGLSPIEVAAKIADLDARGLEFLRAFFVNRGIPAGMLKLQSRVDPIERRRIKDAWLENYGGLTGWFNLAVLDGGADYQQLGLGLNELNMDAIFTQTETRLAMIMGVPLILLGSMTGLSRSTHANYQSAMKHFWISTLKPLYVRIADGLTMGLASEFPGRPRWITFDLSQVEALQEAAKDLRTFAVQGWSSDLLTRNQALALAGQGEVPDGDVYHSEVVTPPPVAPEDQEDEEDQGKPAVRAVAARTNGHTNGNGHHPSERHEAQSDDPYYRAVHRIADHLSPRMRNRFIAAINEMREGIDQEALILAVQSGSADGVVRAIPWDVFERRFGEGAHELLTTAVGRAGVASANELARDLDIAYSFNLNNPSALAWAQSHSGKLIQDIGENTRAAINTLVSQSQIGGGTVQEVAREVRQMVGLLPRQITAVQRFQERLMGQGVTGDMLTRRVDRYTTAQLRARAENIARTELMTAANQGAQTAWEDAEIKGFLRADETFKVVIVTDDDRLDDECEHMDGEEAPLHEAFSNGFQQPPFHNS